MEATAKLLTAIGTLVGAVAWPAVVLTLGLFFKREVRAAFARLPSLIDRLRRMKIAGIEADLEKIANASDDVVSGKVTPAQVEAAAKIAMEAAEYAGELLSQLDGLCREYDSIRRTMTAGPLRTQGMTRVIVKMRALAPSLISYIDVYKSSGSPGSRLAAVAMMQTKPDASDLSWLSERFTKDQPFVFYHAALAMQNMATDGVLTAERDSLLAAAEHSLHSVQDFNGTPDRETINVLKQLIHDIGP